MSATIFWNRILSLPSSIRLEAFKHVSRTCPPTAIGKLSSIQERTFFAATRNLARSSKSNASKPSLKKPMSPAEPASSNPSHHNPVPSLAQPPPQSYPTRNFLSKGEAFATHLLQHSNNPPELLLYLAPIHRSFFFKCYIMGFTLLGGSWAFASIISPGGDKESFAAKLPFWVKVISMGPVLFMAGAATLFLTGPSKLISKVSVVAAANASSPPLLRFRIKSPIPLPGMKSKIVDRPMSQVSMDRVMSAEPSVSTVCEIVPLEDASTFSQKALGDKWDSGKKKGILAKIKNIWPQLTIDVRKMCSREGMAYVYIREKDGFSTSRYKMDFWNCTVVDGGWPLARVMEDKEARPRSGILGKIFK
ncbi:hypothetical protein K431DRAFT_284503 [Polychaeton citri CBS 116435]|uniref:Uncharacterized protein n=1 Tax=Polychaeton citri CBS 116435 TaxID=1314669 RepID=A0A9P4QBV6_9PEZI|nr:hypothetical protein K431DRAFT_284503 [Polychaeton citri CBS 116435]